MAEHDPLRAEGLHLADHEVGHRSLERLPVDVRAPGDGEQGHVGPEVAHDARPVPGAGGDVHRPVGRLEEVVELATVVGAKCGARSTRIAGIDEAVHQVPDLGDLSPAVLVAQPEVTEARGADVELGRPRKRHECRDGNTRTRTS